MDKKQKGVFFFLFFIFFIFLANFALAIEFRAPEINYPHLPFPGVLSPQVFREIPGEQAFPLYVKYFYYLFLMIAGLLALGVIISGGLFYLISAGAPVKMIAAKEQITGGILGLVILLSSYLILATINPQLVILRLPGLEKVVLPEIKPPEPVEREAPKYFQIPLGIIIENAVLSEEAQKKLDNIYLTAEAAAKSANELYALSEEIHSLVTEANCGNSICRHIPCSPIGCSGKDYQSDIMATIEKTTPAIEDLEKKQEKIRMAKNPLINDFSQLEAAGALMSLASGVFEYGTRLNIEDFFQKIEITTFPGWEDIDIKVGERIVKKDPVTFYFYTPGNEEVIYLAETLRWGGDAGFPPEPIGGWPEPPLPEPGKLGWPLPLDYFECSSDFGACRPIGGGCSKPHIGIDFSANPDTPVYAAAEGIVITVGYNRGGYGYFIIINHPNLKLSTLYAHLIRRPNVKPGDKIETRQSIGKVGSTGNTTGPHLHFEVRAANRIDTENYFLFKPLDPKDYLPSEPSIKEACYNVTSDYYPGYPK